MSLHDKYDDRDYERSIQAMKRDLLGIKSFFDEEESDDEITEKEKTDDKA